MIFRYEYPGGTWIDLEQPTAEEVRQITKEFLIEERIEAELISPTPFPLVRSDGNVTLLVLHAPSQRTQQAEMRGQEIDFVVGAQCIVTVSYGVVEPIHRLKKLLEAQKIVDGHSTISTGVLLEVLFAHLYASVRDQAEHAAYNLALAERDMFDERERRTIRLISDVNREFLHLESTLANQEEPIARFLKVLEEPHFFGSSFADRAERIKVEWAQALRLIKANRAVASELRETNIALLEARQNEIMRTLTTVNFIFLPLGLISWIFTMRTEGMPIVESPNAFWIVLGLMLVVATILTAFFVKKRWFF